MARLVLTAACDAMARVEDDLARVLDALVAAKEDARRSEVKIARLAVERTSLLLELEESKDEVSSLHSQGGKDKEAMEKDYQKALELIFSYGYRCCGFKHSICGDQQEISDAMPNSVDPLPPKFFVNSRCPPAPTALRGQDCRDRYGQSDEGSRRGSRCRGTRLTFFLC